MKAIVGLELQKMRRDVSSQTESAKSGRRGKDAGKVWNEEERCGMRSDSDRFASSAMSFFDVGGRAKPGC